MKRHTAAEARETIAMLTREVDMCWKHQMDISCSQSYRPMKVVTGEVFETERRTVWSDRDFLEVCPSPCRHGHIPTESGKRSAGSATSKERRRTRNDRSAGGMTHGKLRRPEWDCSRCGTCNLWQQAECRNPERIIAEVTAQTTEAVTSAEAARKAAELAGMTPELVNSFAS